MLMRHIVDFLCLYPSIKCEANCVLSSLKILIELGTSLLNHTLAGPFSVVGKSLAHDFVHNDLQVHEGFERF